MKPSFKKFLLVIGTNLQEARAVNNLDIETAAQAVGISGSLLRQIEKGEYNMTIELLDHLCQLYEISPRDVATVKETRGSSSGSDKTLAK